MDLQDHGRLLHEEEKEPPPEQWELVFMSFVLVIMFAALISDRVAPDHVFVTALAFCLVTGIVTVKEGLQGFANEGVLTVMVLFVVAHGLTVTGAIDWYIGKLMGNPKTCAGAQLRLMVPVTFASAFLNNTPIVAVMIPIVLRWARTIRVSASQLLIPLSYAAIIGGTCTLIGTSTNLVVAGLLEDDYDVTITLFDVTPYGVPVAIIGVAYMMIFGPLLLPGGRGSGSADSSPFDGDEILLGARITSWSPAAGRSLQRSGLRDTGGLYLVSVRRAATGNIHRAVGQEFVLNVGDIVYFSGVIEGFGEFCHEHGLEIVTNELTSEGPTAKNYDIDAVDTSTVILTPMNDHDSAIGFAKESTPPLDDEERLRRVHLMSDIIQGLAPIESIMLKDDQSSTQIVTASDNRGSSSPLVLIGVNTRDRPGLLLDISKGLLRLNLQLHRTEAAVLGEQSVSVWRCSHVKDTESDAEQISVVLNAILEDNNGVEALKKQGLTVVRAKISKNSRLVGHTAAEAKFRENYKAAIVAVQQGGKNVVAAVSDLKFGAGDILVLQVSDDSPLLSSPPETANTSRKSFMNLIGAPKSNNVADDVEAANKGNTNTVASNSMAGAASSDEEAAEALRKDLVVLPPVTENTGNTSGSKEFLVAMMVSPKSNLTKKNIADNGITKVPGVYVVTIERPIVSPGGASGVPTNKVILTGSEMSVENQLQNDANMYSTLDPDEPLQDGDILWFAGDASSIGDLRKIPGLESPQDREIKQMNENVHDRVLVQAVVAKSGPLVGKTVREVGFRTRYGAAVISVHREGHRIHEHPGNIKLHPGDVLLLEAGPTFLKRSANDNHTFALLAEVKDSAPPRLRYLIPALLIVVIMLVVSGVDKFETAPLLVCAVFAAVIMVAIGLLSPQEARDAIDWSLYVAIAAAFGISQSLTNSGLAKVFADFLVVIGESVGIGDAGIFGAVYLATALISSFVTNNAAATLMFPIALGAAVTAGIDLKMMSYCLMLGASDFSTPFGYQTNLMVYGPGGYKTIDYLKIGTPLQTVLWLVSTWVLSSASKWYVSWIISSLVLIVVVVARLGGVAVLNRLTMSRGVGQNRSE